MHRFRPVVVLALTAMVATLVTAPAAARGGPPADAGPPADTGPIRDWVIPEVSLPEGCEDDEVLDDCDVVAPTDLAAVIDDGSGGVLTVQGEIAGAAYVGQRPAVEDWNGRLVVWAHGYRGEFEDNPYLTVDPPPLYEELVADGTAWIASSYRRNSYDPGIGVIDTKNVTQRAKALFGQPEHTYVAGVSMGGHVIGAAIEQFPKLYDGALPACGVMGDVELFDYFLDYNLGAAAFAQGAGADIDVTYPDSDWLGDEVPEIKAALSLHDEFGAPASAWAFDGSLLVGGADLLAGPGETFKAFVEEGSGGVRGAGGPLGNVYDVAWDYWHIAGSGDFFFALGEGDGTIAGRKGIVGQNTDTDYSMEYGSFTVGDDTSLDAAIARVEGSERVRNAQGQKPAPIINGTPGIPVLTMHTLGDLFVPIEMQQIYAREVAANGLSDNLVQRAIRDVGHCTFSVGEWAESYADLFAWVEDGVEPVGDDLVADISDADLGLEWTINDASTDRSTTDFGGFRWFGGRTP